MINDPGAFVSAMRKLEDNDFGAVRPTRCGKLLFIGHPHLDEMVEYARPYTGEKSMELVEDR